MAPSKKTAPDLSPTSPTLGQKLAQTQAANEKLSRQVQQLSLLKEYNQLILESMTNGIITVDHNFSIIVANNASEELLGLKEQDVIGKNIDRFPCLAGLWQVLRQTIDSQAAIVRTEIELIRDTDHKKIVLGVSTAPIKDRKEERIAGAIAIFRDLTELKQMQASLRRKDKLSALGEMAAALAHEIRNPLNPIKGFAQLLEREFPEDDPRLEYTRIIIFEVDRLRQMLTHFLDFTHARELHLVNLDVNQLITNTLQLSMKQEGTSVILFNTELTPDLPLIPADENYLKQVLLNLIQNATDALLEHKGEGGEITLSTRTNGSQVFIDVADNGPGIPRDVAERLFEPFYTTKKNGTGLGLSTSYRIIEDHQGELSFISEAGRGTTFTIKLPCRLEHDL